MGSQNGREVGTWPPTQVGDGRLIFKTGRRWEAETPAIPLQ